MSKWLAIVLVRVADPRLQPLVLPLQPQRPLGPPGVALPVGAAVAGMPPQLGPQVLDPVAQLTIDSPACGTAAALEVDLGQLGPEGRGRGCAGTPRSLGLKCLPIFIRPAIAGGVGKSVSDSRRTWRSSVSTSGRGVS